jgi:hypothetical protein
MDGLLANLFDTIAHKLYHKDYKDITPEEKQEARKIWKDKQEFHNHLGDVYEVFANLEPYPTNDALIRKVIEKFGSFKICSHPASIDIEECKKGKSEWIKKHIIPKYGKYFKGVEYPQNKSIYAINEDGTPNVLIDDFPPYVDAWNNKGGIAIRLQSSLFKSDEEISNYLDQEFSKIPMKESFNSIVGSILVENSVSDAVFKLAIEDAIVCMIDDYKEDDDEDNFDVWDRILDNMQTDKKLLDDVYNNSLNVLKIEKEKGQIRDYSEDDFCKYFAKHYTYKEPMKRYVLKKSIINKLTPKTKNTFKGLIDII